MPVIANESPTPGPASGTAELSTTKMPVPIVAPTPKMVSWNSPIDRSRWPCSGIAGGLGDKRLDRFPAQDALEQGGPHFFLPIAGIAPTIPLGRGHGAARLLRA